MHARAFLFTGILAAAFEAEHGQSSATAGNRAASEKNADRHESDDDDDDAKGNEESAHGACLSRRVEEWTRKPRIRAMILPDPHKGEVPLCLWTPMSASFCRLANPTPRYYDAKHLALPLVTEA
jgi:hypothetical protein